MKITDLTIHEGLTFEQYKALPGYNYSSLNGHEREPSQKMQLGTQVHSYILEPQHFKGDIRIVKPLANAVLQVIGRSLFSYLIPEGVITCRMHHEGLEMVYKGRADLLLPGKIVVDLKIGEDVRKSMDYFNYPDAISGYALSTHTPTALIIAIHPKTCKADVIPVKIKPDYWQQQILLKGELQICKQH